MSLNRGAKEAIVADVVETLNNAQTMVIAEYQGVDANKMTAIRATAREANVYLHILKNTLVRKAVQGTKFEALAEKMVGPLIYGVSEDPIAAAKIISEFTKASDKVKIIAGMYNDKLLDAAAVSKLASIPSRDELLAQIMGVMQQIPASFVRCVNAIKEKKEQEHAA